MSFLRLGHAADNDDFAQADGDVADGLAFRCPCVGGLWLHNGDAGKGEAGGEENAEGQALQGLEDRGHEGGPFLRLWCSSSRRQGIRGPDRQCSTSMTQNPLTGRWRSADSLVTSSDKQLTKPTTPVLRAWYAVIGSLVVAETQAGQIELPLHLLVRPAADDGRDDEMALHARLPANPTAGFLHFGAGAHHRGGRGGLAQRRLRRVDPSL